MPFELTELEALLPGRTVTVFLVVQDAVEDVLLWMDANIPSMPLSSTDPWFAFSHLLLDEGEYAGEEPVLSLTYFDSPASAVAGTARTAASAARTDNQMSRFTTPPF